MRDISMERVNETRENILRIVKRTMLTNEKKHKKKGRQEDYMRKDWENNGRKSALFNFWPALRIP